MPQEVVPPPLPKKKVKKNKYRGTTQLCPQSSPPLAPSLDFGGSRQAIVMQAVPLAISSSILVAFLVVMPQVGLWCQNACSGSVAQWHCLSMNLSHRVHHFIDKVYLKLPLGIKMNDLNSNVGLVKVCNTKRLLLTTVKQIEKSTQIE